MSNKIQLQTNNNALNALIERVNAAKDTAASLPEIGGDGSGGVGETVTLYVCEEGPMTWWDGSIYYVEPNGDLAYLVEPDVGEYQVLKNSIVITSKELDQQGGAALLASHIGDICGYYVTDDFYIYADM